MTDKTCRDADTTEDNSDPMGMADALMSRGDFLRKLRLMEKADLEEREQHQDDQDISSSQEDSCGLLQEDRIDSLPNGKSVLRYSSYLEHQRYYDDLKHVDYSYIDYGLVQGGGRLIIEQDKTLGKGGLCWDAAFILAEHLIANQDEWRTHATAKVVELGSGTGLCGLMVAKAVQQCHVHTTDLPQLMDLMTRNVTLNFDLKAIVPVEGAITNDMERSVLADVDKKVLYEGEGVNDAKKSAGLVSSSVLRWGNSDDYQNAPYDVVIGADVVASLYDPVALAQTIHSLCHEKSLVYVSYKGRLTGPHEQFERELESLFESVTRIKLASRNKNPNVWILKASRKRKFQYESCTNEELSS